MHACRSAAGDHACGTDAHTSGADVVLPPRGRQSSGRCPPLCRASFRASCKFQALFQHLTLMLCTTAARPGACSVAHTPRQVAPAVRLESPAPSRRAHRRHAKLHCVAERTASASAPPPPAASGAATALGAGSLPFHPDCRCGGEDVPLPPLSQCHHYINLTNGIEAVPRLQALGLSYR